MQIGILYVHLQALFRSSKRFNKKPRCIVFVWEMNPFTLTSDLESLGQTLPRTKGISPARAPRAAGPAMLLKEIAFRSASNERPDQLTSHENRHFSWTEDKLSTGTRDQDPAYRAAWTAPVQQ